MKSHDRSLMIYQIRLRAARPSDDVMVQLTQAIWRVLEAAVGPKHLDPQRWPDLFIDISKIFKNRLTYFEGCGHQEECRTSVGVYDLRFERGLHEGPIYLLTLRGGLLRFVEGLASLAWRRFGDSRKVSKARRQNERARLQDVIHRALTPYVFYNEACSTCHVRQTADETRRRSKTLDKDNPEIAVGE